MRAVKSRVLPFAVLLLTADGASAQPRASFSGTWLSASGPQQLVITQDATQLTVTDARGRLRIYRLDRPERDHLSYGREVDARLAGEVGQQRPGDHDDHYSGCWSALGLDDDLHARW